MHSKQVSKDVGVREENLDDGGGGDNDDDDEHDEHDEHGDDDIAQ